MELAHHCYHGNCSVNIMQVFHIACHDLKLTMVGGVRSDQLERVVRENFKDRLGCGTQTIRLILFVSASGDVLTDCGWWGPWSWAGNDIAATSGSTTGLMYNLIWHRCTWWIFDITVLAPKFHGPYLIVLGLYVTVVTTE